MTRKMHARTKTVVVSGASAGVGRAVARRFAEEGANVVLMSRDRERLEQAAREVEELGGKALVCPTDVADPEAVEEAAERAEQEFGPIDVWINVAMVTIFGPVDSISPDEFKRSTEVTYLGTVYGTMAALKRMKARDRGTIVQVGSALAYRSIPLQSAYCGAKHAIVGFTDSLRSELIHDKSRVRLTMVHLPGVNTPQFNWARNKLPMRMQPVPPIYEPEVPAEMIHYAAHHPRREFWVGWPTWQVILGQKIAPGLLDHYLAKAAYSGQTTSQKEIKRADNLYEPVRGAYEARGRFEREARSSSSQVYLSERPALAAAAAAMPLVAFGAGICAYLMLRNGGRSPATRSAGR